MKDSNPQTDDRVSCPVLRIHGCWWLWWGLETEGGSLHNWPVTGSKFIPRSIIADTTLTLNSIAGAFILGSSLSDTRWLGKIECNGHGNTFSSCLNKIYQENLQEAQTEMFSKGIMSSGFPHWVCMCKQTIMTTIQRRSFRCKTCYRVNRSLLFSICYMLCMQMK